jgi:hypothetical protein
MTDPTDQPYRSRVWSSDGYYVCSHMGCSKKANSTVKDHDCCGRCRRGSDCLSDAINNYDGPGSFAHTYWEPLIHPRGVCGTCGEPPEAH